MPNFCNNKLKIVTSTPALVEFLKTNGLSFEAIVKPKNPDGGEITIYHQSQAWGTKWDLDKYEAKIAAESLLEFGECGFDTAWSPPVAAIIALSKLTGASFTLAYYESGNQFAGKRTIADNSFEIDYDWDGRDDDELKAFIYDELGFDEEYFDCEY